MYLALIIIGVALVAIGIVGIVKKPTDNETSASDTSVGNSNGGQKTYNEVNKEKGNDFECFVADCFADRDVFKLLNWNQGPTSPGGVYAENVTDPDFHIKQRFSENFECEYYVEAKYNSRWSNGNTITLNDYQLVRYREFQNAKHRKVLLTIGIGGEAANPAEFYVVPLDSISQTKLSSMDLAPYKLLNPHHNFRNYVYEYFNNEVFPKARERRRS